MLGKMSPFQPGGRCGQFCWLGMRQEILRWSVRLSMRILLGLVMGLAKINIQQGKLYRYRCRNWS